jgi:hypothetical protein
VQTVINHEDFDPRLRQQGDEQLMVKFEIRPKVDQEASAEAGRPVSIDREYISIRAPGAADTVIRPATEGDRQRFPRHYAAFKQRITTDDVLEGTLLKDWPQIRRSQVEELSFHGIKTVEQLAAVSDANGQPLMGFHGLKSKAKEWLKIASQGVNAQKLQAELDKRDEQIAELMAKMEELTATKKSAKRTAKTKE